MRYNIINNILAVAILTFLTLTSCLSDGEDVQVVAYSDCAITSFSLGTLTINLTDSTTTTYSGSAYAFTIDQYAYKIYNETPLKNKTNLKSIPCTIETKNAGLLFKTLPDSTNYHFASGDTLDFSQGSREMIVLSSDGTCAATYTITVNISEEEESGMIWYEPIKLSEGLDDTQKSFVNNALAPKDTLVTKDKETLVVMGTSNGKEYARNIKTDNIYIVKRNSEGIFEDAVKENIMADTPLPHSNISLIASPHGKKGTAIIAKDSNNRNITLYKSENDGELWMRLTNEYNTVIPDSAKAWAVDYGKYLVALASNNKFYLSEDCGRTWRQRYFMTSTDALAKEEIIALAKDDDNIIWIFTKSGYAYRCKYNG